MAIPDNLNPFSQPSIYDKYQIDPFATLQEISDQLRGITAELDVLPKEERAECIADLQQALNKIKNHRLRVLLNAHIMDRLDTRKVLETLDGLPGPTAEDVSLPALGISQIVMEGECRDYSEDDFTQIPSDPKIELDFDQVQEHFQKRPVERYIVFES